MKREKAELESKLTESIASDMEQLNKQVNDLQMELEAANEVRDREGGGVSEDVWYLGLGQIFVNNFLNNRQLLEEVE